MIGGLPIGVHRLCGEVGVLPVGGRVGGVPGVPDLCAESAAWWYVHALFAGPGSYLGHVRRRSRGPGRPGGGDGRAGRRGWQVLWRGGGEAAAFEDAAAFVVHALQEGDVGVEVVMGLDVGFPGFGVAHDAADLLDDASLERDGAGQEERIETRCVEALAGEFVDRQEHQRLIVFLGQGRTDLGAFGRRHAAVQDQWGDAVWLEGFGELVEVFDAVGQGQAAPAAPGGVGDVRRDQMVAACGVGEFVVDGLDGGAVGAGLIGREARGVHDEVLGEGAGVFDLVADRPHCMVITGSIWSAR